MKSFCALILLLVFTTTFCYSIDITGIVKGTGGEPLQGVSVYLEGTSKGAISTKKGVYHIKNVQPGEYTLRSSLIGYNTETKLVQLKQENLAIDFNMAILPVKVDEVVVTANKREENIQTVPITMSALTSEKLQDLGVNKRGDLDGLSPNLRAAETGSHMTDMIIIRGMFPKNITGTSALYYFDGVPILGYGMNPVNLMDIERVEVLKGPQGTVYGRNALSGVINIVSNKPSNTTRFNLGAGYGNYNNMYVQAGISGPILKESLFGRVSGFYSSKDGFFTNKFDNSNAGGAKSYGGLVNIGFYPIDRFSVEVFSRLEYLDENAWPMTSTIKEAMDNDYEINRDFNSYVEKMNIIGALKLNYKFDFMDIISTTSYQNISGMDWYYDADFVKYDVMRFRSNSDYNVLTEELRFEPKLMDNLNLTAGLFFMHYEDNDDSQAILGKDYPGLPVSPIFQYLKGPQVEDNYAAFIHAKYLFFNKLGVTAGFRFDMTSMDVDRTSYFRYQDKPIPLPPFNVDGHLDLTHEYNFFSQKYALDYILADQKVIYASASSGFNSGGFNAAGNLEFPYYDPEYIWNYELGVKTTWLNNRLRLNLAGFFIDWKDQQLLVLGDLSSPLQTMTNAGRTNIPGLELETSIIPFNGFRLDWSLGIMKTELIEYEYDVKKDTQTIHFDYSGNELPNAPRISSFVSLSYEYPINLLTAADRVGLNLSHVYTDSYYNSHFNFNKNNPRNLLNARVGFFTRNFDLSFWMNNILDHKYVYAAYEFRGGENALLGAPRTFGVTFNFKYDLTGNEKAEM